MNCAYVYILFSEERRRFYVGFTTFPAEFRYKQHLDKFYKGSFTTRANDWELYLVIKCSSEHQARQIEAHIKRMKSKKFIENLKRYPEIIDKLLNNYRLGS